MPHTIETTCYKFEELTEQAKEKAINDNYDFNVSYDWWEFVYEDAATIGIKITGFDLGRRRDISGELKDGMKTVCEKIISEHGETCDTYKTAKEYLNRLIPLTVALTLIEDYDKSMEIESEIEELETEFTKAILNDYWKMLESEYDYLTSSEAIAESLISNDYDFEEDGSRF